MEGRIKRRIQRSFTRKRRVLLRVVLTLSFLLAAVLLISGCTLTQEKGESNSSDGENAGVTAADIRVWFGPYIAKTMSDEQVKSLAQQLLTVIGDSRMSNGVTVTLDAAMRDEGRILLSFTMEGDRKLIPSSGKLEVGKSWMRSHETEQELKNALPDLSEQEIEEYLNEIKQLQENIDESSKSLLEITSFQAEDGSQHMLVQLDTFSDVEEYNIHLEEFGGIAGPFDFEVSVPIKDDPLIYNGSVAFTAAGDMEMTLTKVSVCPMSGVSAELTLGDNAGILPENDEEFNKSVTVNMIRWNDTEAANASTATHTEGSTITTTMSDYGGKAITPEDVTAIKIGCQWIELRQMVLDKDSRVEK